MVRNYGLHPNIAHHIAVTTPARRSFKSLHEARNMWGLVDRLVAVGIVGCLAVAVLWSVLG